MLVILIVLIVIVVITVLVVLCSLHSIGPSEIGLVNKRLARRSLSEGDPVALNGEAGYQHDLLMPGLRFKLWPIYAVTTHPWVQVPAGEIGVVIAQVGGAIKIGAKSADFNPAFGNFSQLQSFLANGGQKGVQRPVLPPGTLAPIHPAAFLVITADRVYGVPVSGDLRSLAALARWADTRCLRPDRRAAGSDSHLPARGHRHGRHRDHSGGRAALQRRHQ